MRFTQPRDINILTSTANLRYGEPVESVDISCGRTTSAARNLEPRPPTSSRLPWPFHHLQCRVCRQYADSVELSVDALTVALNHGSDGVEWYVSTTNLQMASWDLCVTCRSLAMPHIVVNRDTPLYLWLRRKQEAFRNKGAVSRIPALRSSSITWAMPPEFISEGSKLFLQKRGNLISGFRRLLRWSPSRNEATATWWPTTLRKMSFAPTFDHSISDILWPGCLEQLIFGREFDQAINNVQWPTSL